MPDPVLLSEAAFVQEVSELTDVHLGERTSFGDALHIVESFLCLAKLCGVSSLLRLVHLHHVERLGVPQRVDLRNIQRTRLIQALFVF